MAKLRESLLEMHFKAQISKIITLKGKSKKIGHKLAKISKDHYLKQEIKRNCYFKSTFNPVEANIIALNMKSKEIITSNHLLSQNRQK